MAYGRGGRRRCGVWTLWLLSLWLPVAALAGPLDTPLDSGWVTNGTVYAIAHDDASGLTYIGGDFTEVRPSNTSGAPIYASSGLPWASFPKVNGTILAVAADGAGGWYIGGTFTQAGSLARNNIAHILSDGNVDPVWNPNASDAVWALAVSGGTVYAGGWFTSIGGQPRNYIAALDRNGIPTDWNPDADNIVYGLATSGGTVYASGQFTSIGGQSRNYIAALDSSGKATAWNPNADNLVWTLAVSNDTVYAGGFFTNIGGLARNHLAALDSSGNATAWNPNPGYFIYALAFSGDTVYAGGGFSNIGGEARNNIAALDSNGNATAWNPNADFPVLALAVNGGTVYAGGDFTSIGAAAQPRNQIAALDAGTGEATDWNPNASFSGSGFPDVYALAISGGNVYAGGQFDSIGGQSRNDIAALDGSGNATAWNPNANGPVFALTASGGNIYVGGQFSSIGGQPRSNFAIFTLRQTTTALVSNLNPSRYGQPVTLTATVSPSAATSTVTFKDGGTDLGASALVGGTASYVTSGLSVGSHSITAVYGGDDSYARSTSSAVAQSVNKANTTTLVSTSLNPSNYGNAVTFTATVSPPATGSVQFFDGASSLGSGSLNGNSQSTVTTSVLTAGSHSITGVYAGSAAFNGSTSPPLTQNVNASVTVATNLVGLAVSVDGNNYTAPQTFNWVVGSSHMLAVSSPQAGTSGTRYAFTKWSDAKAQSHSITTPATPTTYTAHFGTEYQLTLNSGTGGSIIPASGNWYAAGSSPSLISTASNSGYVFDGWTLNSGTGPVLNPASALTQVTMNGPTTVSAAFKAVSTTLTAAITGKTGTAGGVRFWHVTVTNTGGTTATDALLDGLTLSTSGACKPTVVSDFPVGLGDINPGGSKTGQVWVDFTGCKPSIKFSVNIRYSVDGGTSSGATPLSGMTQ